MDKRLEGYQLGSRAIFLESARASMSCVPVAVHSTTTGERAVLEAAAARLAEEALRHRRNSSVYSELPLDVGAAEPHSDESSPVAAARPAEAPVPCTATVSDEPVDIRRYLPSWSISKSPLWAMVEAAVDKHLMPHPDPAAPKPHRAAAAVAIAGTAAAASKVAPDVVGGLASTAVALALAGTATGLGPADAELISPVQPLQRLPTLSLFDESPSAVLRAAAMEMHVAPPLAASASAGAAENPRQASVAEEAPVTAMLGLTRAAQPVLMSSFQRHGVEAAVAAGMVDSMASIPPPLPAGMGPKPLPLTPFLTATPPRDAAAAVEASSFFASRNMVRFSRQLRTMASMDGGVAMALAAAAAGAGSGGLAATRRSFTLAEPLRQYSGGQLLDGLVAPPLAASPQAGAAAAGSAGVTSAASAAAAGAGVGAGSALLAARAVGAAADVELTPRRSNAPLELFERTLAEVLAGAGAPPCERLRLRRRVRAIVTGASVAWVAANVLTVGQALGSVDFSNDLPNSTKAILDLLFNWHSFAEVARDLAEIGMAVSLGWANNSAAEADVVAEEACLVDWDWEGGEGGAE
ncbi:hypothetical protein HYH03_006056 [Edaphochlamys debaryana]|uniref:Uncharacterized protein n=1 Tax=Edaphochlamys debaryana TaxID=47281 RepID=A0A835YBG3_9CHLO|nr:hypothetical protein HYH03_006056 [Edaphochlamys debaryana]|eukprot:KAG2495815.1 hypothetical protein HYH03_006056 [Edaphochlamys debaryana]